MTLKVAIGVILVFICLSFSCSLTGLMVPENRIYKALKAQGYTEVVILERHWIAPSCYGGGERDDAVFDVRAKNPVGKYVDIRVSAGWPFKGATIRIK